MLGRRHVFLVVFLEPVGIGMCRSVVVPLAVIIVRSGTIIFRLCRVGILACQIILDAFHSFIIEDGATTGIDVCRIEVSGPIQRVGHVRKLSSCTETHVTRIVHLYFSCLTTLCCNHDYTECSTRTVNRSRSSILQYRNAFNIIRVQRVHVAFNTVNQNQRRVH